MIKLSRSAIEQYLNCKRCFVLMYKYKVRLNTLPFTLNSAVDNLCKNEFDYYRDKQEPHPLFLENGIDAVPFKHADMDKWRNNFQGISYYDSETDVHWCSHFVAEGAPEEEVVTMLEALYNLIYDNAEIQYKESK